MVIGGMKKRKREESQEAALSYMYLPQVEVETTSDVTPTDSRRPEGRRDGTYIIVRAIPTRPIIKLRRRIMGTMITTETSTLMEEA